MRTNTLADFLSKVVITDNCWLWSGKILKDGYGKYKYQNRDWRAHRLAYQLLVGSLDESLLVCHTCDNPVCVNPKHLFQGTHQDNAIDRERKGRGYKLKGSMHPHAKLNEDKAKTIRILYESGGIYQHELAKLFGVSQNAIWDVVNYRSWKHVE